MSSPMKLSVLALLVSSALAGPHYGGYGSRHHPKPSNVYGTGSSGRPTTYPTTGNYWGSNSTQVAYPTGTGAAPSQVPGDKTTTLEETLYSTETLVSTIYGSQPAGEASSGAQYGAPSSVPAVAADVSTGAAVCGPETVTVTATNQVTITVGGGSGGAVPSASSPAESVSAPANPGYGGETPASPSKGEISYPAKPVEAAEPAEPTEDVYSILPVTSEKPVETPVPSQAPSKSAVPSVVESSTPVSSAATEKPTGGASYSGSKRGLAYNDATLCSAFEGGSFGWAHNWGAAPDGNLPKGVNFFPTCHRPALYEGEEGAKKWFKLVDDAVSQGSTAVLGFNEPDEPTQFPISVDKACTEWKRLMNPLAKSHPNLNILSLSVTNGGESHKGLSYLQDWVDTCKDAVFHAINIHFYDIYDEGTVDRLQAQIEKAAKTFDKPIWLGEFGLHKDSASDEQAAKFLEGALKYLDGADQVAGYSYFKVGNEQYQLNSGSGLSSAGKIYASS